MASIASLPASPFDSTSPPSSPRAHRRQFSRNRNTVPLPVFSFNPGLATGLENKDQNEDAESGEDLIRMEPADHKSTRPPPLPDFKFNPGADPLTEPAASQTHPVLQEMALNQQRASRSARPAPLPAFSFAPSGSSQPSPSPTRPTFPDLPQSNRSMGGHRRRGSEFVGGGSEGSQLISASPEKPDHRPSGSHITGAPRGHAHRRSQAISISDIDTSELIKANAIAKARAGSTPATPSEVNQQFVPVRHSPPSRQSISSSAISPPSSPQRRGSAPGARPRVGFADRVDVIPRPLSMISSETEGSVSTVRGGHSLSGSINSIASPSRWPASLTSSPQIEFESPPIRPQTADPATMIPPNMSKPGREMSMINLPKRPLSASGSPGITSSGSPPCKKKHFWFSNSTGSTPTPSPRSEISDPMSSVPTFLPVQPPDTRRPKTSPERIITIKKRKYHTWTSGIFSRKTGKRSSKVKAKRTPTPPALTRRASDRVNAIFDADDTIVLREPSPVEQRKPVPQPPKLSITSSFAYVPTSNQITSPIIDLDAALGPFGSDEKFGQETPSRSAASRIAKLHSSERRGNIDAFGVYHRRAESAPAMPAVNHGTFGVHRMNSNASLAEDVFDEEEEDNFLAGETTTPGIMDPALKAEPCVATDTPTQPGVDVACETSSTTPRPKSLEGLGLAIVNSSPDGVVIVDTDDDIAHVDARSSKSTIEAPIFPDSDFGKESVAEPLPFVYPAPQSHYASSTEGRTTSASMISSPDPDHVTFDSFPRNATYLGEPNSEFILRASNDDLPSLSDSISSGARPRISSSTNTRSSAENRAHSMFVPSTAKPAQAWKRASLASLNRLIPGTANGSKLKFESVPTASVEQKTKKKTNRLSKLMQFWRSREKVET